MKVVINKCFGGFGLSMAAVKRMAELNGRDCYFFTRDYKTDTYIPIHDDAKHEFWNAFDIPNPNEVLKSDKAWYEMTEADKKAHNALYEKHSLPSGRDLDRTDKTLIQVVRELGKKANGMCADLEIITIPDGIDWQIEEYDGNEHIAESHRTFG